MLFEFLRRVMHLPHDAQPHRVETGLGGLVESRVGGAELTHRKLGVEVLEAAPQHRQRATVGLGISAQLLD